MVFVIRRREFVCVAASAAAFGATAARAEGKAGSGVYPVAVPTYQVMFVAQAKGFFKDEGWDFKLIQGGSGVKTREILASRQATSRSPTSSMSCSSTRTAGRRAP
jgi:NitT/TauT family transport system substrate-binding protein